MHCFLCLCFRSFYSSPPSSSLSSSSPPLLSPQFLPLLHELRSPFFTSFFAFFLHICGIAALFPISISPFSQFPISQKWQPEADSDDQRYPGSDELFVYIKKSMRRCSKLNKKNILFELFKVSFAQIAY